MSSIFIFQAKVRNLKKSANMDKIRKSKDAVNKRPIHRKVRFSSFAACFLSFYSYLCEMNISPHFTLKEFASHDGAPTPPHVLTNLQELCKNLEVLRAYLNFPIQITSGYRSPAHNKAVGGASKSQHVEGKAADIKCMKYTPDQVHAAILHLIKEGKMEDGGVGRYDNFTHYDIATSRRWDLRTKK